MVLYVIDRFLKKWFFLVCDLIKNQKRLKSGDLTLQFRFHIYLWTHNIENIRLTRLPNRLIWSANLTTVRWHLLLLVDKYRIFYRISWHYITKPSNTETVSYNLSQFIKMMFYGLLFVVSFPITHQANIRTGARQPASRPYKSLGLALTGYDFSSCLQIFPNLLLFFLFLV